MSIRSAFVGTCISKLQDITLGCCCCSSCGVLGRNGEEDEDEDSCCGWREPITFESVNFLTNSGDRGGCDNEDDDEEEEDVIVMVARFCLVLIGE